MTMNGPRDHHDHPETPHVPDAMRDDMQDRPNPFDPLGAADAAAVDALLDGAPADAVDADRLDRARRVLGLLDLYEDRLDRAAARGGDDAVVDRTMALVDAAARATAGSYRFPDAARAVDHEGAGRGRFRRRLQNVVTIAAAALVVIGVTWSILDEGDADGPVIEGPKVVEGPGNARPNGARAGIGWPGGGSASPAADAESAVPAPEATMPGFMLRFPADDPIHDALRRGDVEAVFSILESRGLWTPPTPLVSPVPRGSVMPGGAPGSSPSGAAGR